MSHPIIRTWNKIKRVKTSPIDNAWIERPKYPWNGKTWYGLCLSQLDEARHGTTRLMPVKTESVTWVSQWHSFHPKDMRISISFSCDRDKGTFNLDLQHIYPDLAESIPPIMCLELLAIAPYLSCLLDCSYSLACSFNSHGRDTRFSNLVL